MFSDKLSVWAGSGHGELAAPDSDQSHQSGTEQPYSGGHRHGGDLRVPGHGRVRGERNAARTLDLDLLLFGADVIREPSLTVPHPRMHERAFVLLPLAEIGCDAIIPGHGAVASLLAQVADQRIDRVDADQEAPLHRR